MKLNDPFGRMASRHQVGYESMRDTLRRGGVKTPQAAQELIHQSKQRAVKFSCIGLVVLLLLVCLLPKALPIAFGLVLFFGAWVASTTINGRRYIERFIDEELQ